MFYIKNSWLNKQQSVKTLTEYEFNTNSANVLQ